MNPAIPMTKTLLIIGAVHLDDIAQPDYPLVSHASNPVAWTQRIGGVAANAACAAARTLDKPTKDLVEIMAAVGDDFTASQLKQALNSAGVGTRLMKFKGAPTGRYTAIMTHDGELHIGLADVSLAERLGESEDHIAGLNNVQAVLVDANLSEKYLTTITQQTNQHDFLLAAMSVSPVKTLRLLSIAGQIDLLYCNRREALSMNSQLPDNASLTELADGLCRAGFTQFVLTDGSSPLLVQDLLQRVELEVANLETTHNVNGAGDALAGASFAAWSNGMDLIQAVQEIGLAQAAMIVCGDHNSPMIEPPVS
ncbi:PfkB family carbohydrate kinase [Granulosicoccus sp.]|nr:PfkB family carbohydrate kinase [Granulosicoccus sp.]MDB4223070.1 PfkB family carbohydrate kinase [Granulosicoccus sp.]